MIAALLKIRWLQFNRSLNGLGLFRSLFLLVLMGFLAFYANIQAAHPIHTYYLVFITLFLTTTLHLRRKDKPFLFLYAKNPQRIYRIEYYLTTSPIWLLLTIHSQWVPLLVLIVSIFFIGYLHLEWKAQNLNTCLQKTIPAACFEWKSGLRKSFFFIVPLWVTGLLTSAFAPSIPVIIFILAIIPLNFYEKGEPYQMIVLFELNAKHFLWHKIKLQVLIFTALCLPLMVSFIVFHPEFWHIVVFELLIFHSLHIYFIVTKYAFYQPNSQSSAAHIFGSIGAVSAIVAILLPLVWVMTIRFYFKSIANLNQYLHDYD